MSGAVYFYEKVKYGGDWDFKSQSSWGLKPDVTYIYHGSELRYDDIGNIHYGYVGRELFSLPVLLFAAGAAQIKNDIFTRNTWPQFEHFWCNYDDPRDQFMVFWGCTLWDKKCI